MQSLRMIYKRTHANVCKVCNFIGLLVSYANNIYSCVPLAPESFTMKHLCFYSCSLVILLYRGSTFPHHCAHCTI